MPRARRYWLMKSEPDVYSIDDLKRDGKCGWEGVRNYQARNFMRDDMRVGDGVLFYHSNANPSGVAGIARISGEAIPDLTALDPDSDYYDPKSSEDNPRWCMVEVEFVEAFPEVLALAELKADERLTDMLVVQRGQRLSIQPVEKKHFDIVLKMGRKKQ